MHVPSLQVRITILFNTDLPMPRIALLSFPATPPIFWNVSTHFYYPYAHPVIASFTRCFHNRRILITYRATLLPSWENGTWQVPSQLLHSDLGPLLLTWINFNPSMDKWLHLLKCVRGNYLSRDSSFCIQGFILMLNEYSIWNIIPYCYSCLQ